jgi:hypothetical protein
VSNSRPSRRGRHGVVGALTGLEKVPALFETRRCELIFDVGPQNAIGGAGEDALNLSNLLHSIATSIYDSMMRLQVQSHRDYSPYTTSKLVPEENVFNFLVMMRDTL